MSFYDSLEKVIRIQSLENGQIMFLCLAILKMAKFCLKKWPNLEKWPNDLSYGQTIRKMANFLKFGHKMAKLDTLTTCTVCCNVVKK